MRGNCQVVARSSGRCNGNLHSFNPITQTSPWYARFLQETVCTSSMSCVPCRVLPLYSAQLSCSYKFNPHFPTAKSSLRFWLRHGVKIFLTFLLFLQKPTFRKSAHADTCDVSWKVLIRFLHPTLILSHKPLKIQLLLYLSLCIPSNKDTTSTWQVAIQQPGKGYKSGGVSKRALTWRMKNGGSQAAEICLLIQLRQLGNIKVCSNRSDSNATIPLIALNLTSFCSPPHVSLGFLLHTLL